MIKKEYINIFGLSVMVLFSLLLHACGSPSYNPVEIQPSPEEENQIESPSTDTSIPLPIIDTLTNTPDSGYIPPPTQTLTNTPDIPTIPPPTSPAPTIPPPSLTFPSPPPQQPANPSNTPDIGTAPPPGDPRIAVSPFTGPIPTTYNFKIENFEPGEQVTIQIISKSTFQVIDTSVIFMDGNGGLIAQWTSKPDHTIGSYYVKATGANHGKFAIGEFDIE